MVDIDKPTQGPGHTRSDMMGLEIMRHVLPSDARRIALDIGCGKGRCLRGRAAADPGTWFIGIDRILSRLQRLAKRAGREGLHNIRLWHCDVDGTFLDCLPRDCISECTIFFPDPWPKRRHHRRRLITTPFLDGLHRVLLPGGCVYLATDHANYFQWIQRTFSRNSVFHSCRPLMLPPDQQSDFEVLFAAKDIPVYRCGYQLTGAARPHSLSPPRPNR